MQSSGNGTRRARVLIGQARTRTHHSINSVLQTANRILTFQLHSPGVVLETWTLYQLMVTPKRTSFSSGGTQES